MVASQETLSLDFAYNGGVSGNTGLNSAHNGGVSENTGLDFAYNGGASGNTEPGFRAQWWHLRKH
jgi:hypothetical protein